MNIEQNPVLFPPQESHTHFTKAQQGALDYIVSNLRQGGFTNKQIGEALPEVSKKRIRNSASGLIGEGVIQALPRGRQRVEGTSIQKGPIPLNYDQPTNQSHLLTELFIRLYQAAKNDEVLPMEKLNTVLLTGQVNYLNGYFQRLGIQIQPMDDGNYHLSNNKPVSDIDIFLRLALLEEAQIKASSSTKLSAWTRQRNMVGIYYGTDLTYQELADKMGLTRQNWQQLVATGVKNLWDNCTPALQEAFPIEILDLRKPLALKARQRNSARRNPKDANIRKLIGEDKPIPVIKEELGLSGGDIVRARIRLRDLGMEVPYVNRVAENTHLLNDLQTEQDFEKLKELLGSVNRAFYATHTKGADPLLESIQRVAREAGFHPSRGVKEFIETLERANFPFGTFQQEIKQGPQKGIVHYYFILGKLKEKAVQIFRKDPDLKGFSRNPVSQIYGTPVDKLPTTTDFQRSKESQNYAGLNDIIACVVFRRAIKRFDNIEEVMDGCPVPIFRYQLQIEGGMRGKYVFQKTDEVELVRFLRGKFLGETFN